jgi:hypothetical protein
MPGEAGAAAARDRSDLQKSSPNQALDVCLESFDGRQTTTKRALAQGSNWMYVTDLAGGFSGPSRL